MYTYVYKNNKSVPAYADDNTESVIPGCYAQSSLIVTRCFARTFKLPRADPVTIARCDERF